MKRIIWKVAFVGSWLANLPADARVVACQLQHLVPTLWFELALPTGARYVGTVQEDGGAFVRHIYEVVEL